MEQSTERNKIKLWQRPATRAVAIVAYILLTIFSIFNLAGLIKNQSYLSWHIGGSGLQFFHLMLFINLSSLLSGLFFLLKSKVFSALICMALGIGLLFLFFSFADKL